MRVILGRHSLHHIWGSLVFKAYRAKHKKKKCDWNFQFGGEEGGGGGSDQADREVGLGGMNVY